MKNIAILASGAGTNAGAIMRHFASSDSARTLLLIADRPRAGAIERAAEAGVECLLMSPGELGEGGRLLEVLQARGVDFVVLAGYLRMIPAAVTRAYRGRIVNIHPSLLPAYGGRGMYGMNVHRAVLAAGERRSGITIHLVDEQYDHGAVVAQYECEVLPGDTPESLAQRIHALEHLHYPPAIERLISETC